MQPQVEGSAMSGIAQPTKTSRKAAKEANVWFAFLPGLRGFARVKTRKF